MNTAKRIAVTGARGFIGRHVLECLAALDRYEVIAAGRSPEDILSASNVEAVALDISQAGPGTYARLGRPDMLIHLAWEGLPNYRALRHFEIELPAQYRFLKGLIEEGLPSLLVTGTCFEYGLQAGALHERLPAQPVTVYGFAKDALRRQLEFLRQTMPFEWTWARLFYSYGEGQAAGSLLPLLSAAVARGDPSFAMSMGEQLRDYLPVEEVAQKLVALALRGNGAGIVNVCAGRPISVRALVESWIARHGWKITLDRGKFPIPDYEPMAFWGDDSYFNSLF